MVDEPKRETMNERHGNRTHHHVQLPGGRKIEVVYLDDRDGVGSPAPAAWPDDISPGAPGEALHVCPQCAGGLVHPLDWIEESPANWRVTLRCPDCGELRDGVFGQALIERLDDELDRATAEMLSDLRQITHANMADEIERFARALELDLIGPADF